METGERREIKYRNTAFFYALIRIFKCLFSRSRVFDSRERKKRERTKRSFHCFIRSISRLFMCILSHIGVFCGWLRFVDR